MEIRKETESIRNDVTKPTKEKLDEARRAFNTFKGRLADAHGQEGLRKLLDSVCGKDRETLSADERDIADLMDLARYVGELDKHDKAEGKIRQILEGKKA